MLEIIIALLLALGVNINQEAITVIDDRTGEVYGVGNNINTGGKIEGDTKTYGLYQDEDGKYYLVPK